MKLLGVLFCFCFIFLLLLIFLILKKYFKILLFINLVFYKFRELFFLTFNYYSFCLSASFKLNVCFICFLIYCAALLPFLKIELFVLIFLWIYLFDILLKLKLIQLLNIRNNLILVVLLISRKLIIFLFVIIVNNITILIIYNLFIDIALRITVLVEQLIEIFTINFLS